MNHFKFVATVAVMACNLLSGPAFADDNSDIKAVYSTIESGMKALDFKKVASVCTSDFVEVGHGMNMPLSGVKQQFDMMKSMGAKCTKMVITPNKISIKGDHAVVLSTGVGEFAANVSKEQSAAMGMPQGKHKMADTSKNRAELVKTGGKWKFKKLEILDQKMTVDGKPFNMGGAPPKKP